MRIVRRSLFNGMGPRWNVEVRFRTGEHVLLRRDYRTIEKAIATARNL